MSEKMRYVTASPSAVRLVNFGGFRLVKDAAQQHNARAAINFGFFSMSKNHPKDSYPVGLVIEQGAMLVIPNKDAMHFSTVYSKDGRVTISEVTPLDADWAVTAGPRLLEAGKVCERSISDPNWVSGGIGPTRTDVARVAIGTKADGKCVLAYWSGATIRQMAEDMLALGCRDALAGDGGGSASWYDGEHPEDSVSLRLVPNMLAVFGEVEGDKPVEVEPTGGERQMIVCIDPGHGGPDPGAVSPEGIQEKKITLAVSKRIAEYLRRAGVKTTLTRDTDKELVAGNDDSAELRARAQVANNAKADYFLSIHCNAASTPDAEGFEVYCYPGSIKGAMLATKIADAYALASGLKRRKVDTANFQVLRDTAMPAALIELGFLTNKADCALLKEPAFLDKCALGIAFGILEMRA